MTILRAGLYERVSSDEQAKFGYSIRAQEEALNEYCEKNKLKVVDHYTDEGVSGGKPLEKRPELMRLIEDVKAGKIDIILFTKLDRWSRNTKEFFKAQDILDNLKVEWKAIHEDYDTTTANGRMAITIFLAIAQNEREKTSERIKVVFENKRKHGEAWYGEKSTPYGYKKQVDENGVPRLVKDPELKDAIQDFWDMSVKYNNATMAMKYVTETYGLKRRKQSWYYMTKHEIYAGICKGVENYCEPYVSKEDFIKFNERIRPKQTKNNRIYLFTSMMPCPGCGCMLKASYTTSKRKDGSGTEYYLYRCSHRTLNQCTHKHVFYESVVERWLLANIEDTIRERIKEIETAKSEPRKKPKNNIKALKEQLRRLEVVYMAGDKTDEEYRAGSAEIKKKIQEAEQEVANDIAEVDVSKLKEFLGSDFRAAYDGMDQLHKQSFWRGLIKTIHVEGNEIKSVDLFF